VGRPRLTASQREALLILDGPVVARRGEAWTTNRNHPVAGFVASGTASALARLGLADYSPMRAAVRPTPEGRSLAAELRGEDVAALLAAAGDLAARAGVTEEEGLALARSAYEDAAVAELARDLSPGVDDPGDEQGPSLAP
jgi:hypothetical protein